MSRDTPVFSTTPGEQAEFEIDLLIHVVGRHLMRRLDTTDPAADAFFDWLARAERRKLRPEERTNLARAAEAFADRMLQRLAAEQTSVLLASSDPVTERRREPERIAVAVEQSARERMAPWIEPAVAAGAGREIWEEPCDTWVRLPDDLPSGRHVALPVSGDSMLPLFHPGDRILIRLGDIYREGDVVVARDRDQGYVVKRVGRAEPARIELTSLNSDYPPMMMDRDGLVVLGTVILCWCSHRQDRPIELQRGGQIV